MMLLLVLCATSACARPDLPPGPSATPVEAGDSGGVPVTFVLQQDGYVTLVIEDASGIRVRNLLSDQWFSAGAHTVYWDGFSEGSAEGYRRNGVGQQYDIVRHRVDAGTYTVRGLVHQGMGLVYHMSVQSPGHPPWHTLDGRGGWLSDHTPAADVLYLPEGSPFSAIPQIMAVAPIAEAGHGIMWLDMDGHKVKGQRMGWEGGFALATDRSRAGSDKRVYAVSVRQGQALTLFAHQPNGERSSLFKARLKAPHDWRSGLSLAVYEGTAVVSLPQEDRLVFVDLDAGRRRCTLEVRNPKGVWVDDQGDLFVVSQTHLLQYHFDWRGCRVQRERPIITQGLDDPRQVIRDPQGLFLVSDWGSSHQVKVFSPQGKLLHAIGHPGVPTTGPYEPRHMRYPNGLTVDGSGRLWVAELDYAPKRISVWDASGAFLEAFYGPPRYGGGGVLDPMDENRFYYTTPSNLDVSGLGARGIAYHLDWANGTAQPASIYAYPTRQHLGADLPSGGPEQPVYLNGHRYMVNVFNQSSSGMRRVVGVWRWNPDETVDLVAVVGYHGRNEDHNWPAMSRQGLDMGGRGEHTFYVWSDENDDGAIQAREVQWRTGLGEPANLYIDQDLSVLATDLSHLPAPHLTAQGVPVWDLGLWQSGPGIERARYADVLRSRAGWVIWAGGPIEGYLNGDKKWQYHAQWFRRGTAPLPARGQLVETSRMLGYAIYPRQGEAGEVWALNSDKGAVYLFTTDGLLLTTLGGDARLFPLLRSPAVTSGQRMGPFSFDAEHFWPTITQLDSDGRVFLTAGKEHSSLFEIDGLDRVQRLTEQSVVVTNAMLEGLPERHIEPAEPAAPPEQMIPILSKGPVIDGDLGDWTGAAWMKLSDVHELEVAVAVDDTDLYLAYNTSMPRLLDNGGQEGLTHLFATGGALDLMLRTRAGSGQVSRDQGVQEGDVRLVLTRLGDPEAGPLKAVRYEQAGRAGPRAVTYVSPVGEVQFADVQEVSAVVRLAQRDGRYELAIPLDQLGLHVAEGTQIRADVGVLLGNGQETQARLYWSNKRATLTADLPSEARLAPRHWGTWVFTAQPR